MFIGSLCELMGFVSVGAAEESEGRGVLDVVEVPAGGADVLHCLPGDVDAGAAVDGAVEAVHHATEGLGVGTLVLYEVQAPAGLRDAEGFAESCYRVRYGAEDERGDGLVEGVVGEVEALGVHEVKRSGLPWVALEGAARPRQHPAGEVHAGDPDALGVVRHVLPRPDAELQHRRAPDVTPEPPPPAAVQELLDGPLQEVVEAGVAVVSTPGVGGGGFAGGDMGSLCAHGVRWSRRRTALRSSYSSVVVAPSA